MTHRQMPAFIGLAALLGACATVPEDAGFDEVRAMVDERAGLDIAWHRGSPEDASVDSAIGAMLEEPLSVDEAVQIALLGNRRLQATYEKLGVAQGELVQAGLLANPLFHAGVGFTEEGLGLEFSVAQSFLSIFSIPLRRRVAEARFNEVRLEVAGEVLTTAWQVRRAFVGQQAADQLTELARTRFAAADAAATLAEELHKAGNLSPLALASEQTNREQARLDLARAELVRQESRERLGALMGLWGERSSWTIAGELPPMPEGSFDVDRFEERSVAASLDLALARQQLSTLLSEMGREDLASLLPDFELGAEAVREDGEWEVGPTAAVVLPLFDHGQGRQRMAEARARQLWHTYAATAIELRADARVVAMRVRAQRARSLHIQQVLAPLRQQVLAHTQRAYNGMLIGGFELLAARVGVIDAKRLAIEALRDYWLARADAELLLQGRRLPASSDGPTQETGAGPSVGAEPAGGH